jgi:apolipoprotein D and lipocalin family protein
MAVSAARFFVFAPHASILNIRMGSALPRPVQAVNLRQYAGKWHQIAALPAWFQDPTEFNTTATYTYAQAADGGPLLHVLNESDTPTGKRRIVGEARLDYSCAAETGGDDDSVPGCLLVSFTPSVSNPIVWPFPAPYWILELAPDYRYAVVGGPKRDMLWLLARDTYIAADDWTHIKSRLLLHHGYTEAQLSRLVWTARYGDEAGEPPPRPRDVGSEIEL